MIIDKIDIPIEPFIVGVSGGADSVCLTLLAHEFAIYHKIQMIAVFVDHQLRPESSTEIVNIMRYFEGIGIKCRVLKWNHEPITHNIEKKAREARYNLLTSICYKLNIKNILIAHHSLDQWETFFMRLSKGSGMSGLCGIKKLSRYNGINIIRPLLKYTPEDIKETLAKKFRFNDYINDPMNEDTKYERVMWRKAYEFLSSKYNLSVSSINTAIERLQKADNCLDNIANNHYPVVFDGLYIKIDLFTQLDDELQIRVLRKVIENVSGTSNKIISYSLLLKTAQIFTKNDFKATNIAGCLFRKNKNKIKVTVENRRPI